MDDITREGLNKAGYKYYAFISYNHKDEKWAKGLQSRLRRYRLPSVARTEIGADVRIDPVFRYKTNLPVAHLREQIREELERSKYLIVICSPNSAKPNVRGEHWVNDEVTRFIKLGRTDRIVPAIVDGVPNSGDDVRECFCPALRETQFSAVNLFAGSRLDRKHEFLRLVAKLLNLEPTQLIREDDEEARRERIKKFLCWLPLILLSVAGGVFVWDALRPVENYYANYVDSYGLPEGIFPLAKDDLRGRSIHYRFEYEGIRFGRSIHADSADWSFINLFGCQRVLRRVVQANSVGQPREWDHTEYSDRSPALEFTYDTNGILRQIVCRKSGGAFQRRLVLSDSEDGVNCSIELKGEKTSQTIMESASVTSSGMMGVGQPGRGDVVSEIAQYQLKRNAQGRTIERRFKDVMGYKFVSDREGVYGFSYKLDGLGRTEELWHLDVNGDRRENKRGVAGRKYHYAGRNMDRAEYVNASGTPTLGHVGWMVCVDEFDKFDNNIRSCFYDAEGKKMTREDGCAESRMEFDAQGNKIACRFFDVNGQLCLHKDGIAEYRCEYDVRGNETRRAFFDVDGNPCLHKDGNAGMITEYDMCGNKIACRVFDVNDRPCLHKDGIAEWRCKYDERGKETRRVYFGIDGKPCLCKGGYAGRISEYSAHGDETRRVYFGVDGKPCLNNDGYAEYRCEYDERGNETRCAFFNVGGKPCLCKGGYAGRISEYSALGDETRRVYFGIDGKPCLCKGGYAGRISEYSAHGDETRRVYFGVDGKPCLNNDGYAEYRCEYDERGNETRCAFFNVGGEPCLHRDGIAGWIVEYDACGNITHRVYFGVDGKPCLRKGGFAGWIAEYDARGQEIRNVWIGVDGKPCLCKWGYAEYRCEYDARGKITAKRYYGVDGKPSLYDDDYAGWIAEYDARGQEIRKVWIGVDGKPTFIKDGYAEYRCEYDARGTRTEVRFYGTDGKRVLKGDCMLPEK